MSVLRQPTYKPGLTGVWDHELDALEAENERLRAALGEFVAAVAAPTGRLRLEAHPEGDVLYAAIKPARDALNQQETPEAPG